MMLLALEEAGKGEKTESVVDLLHRESTVRLLHESVNNVQETFRLEEGVGFEPTDVLPPAVFKTAAIDQTLPAFLRLV